MKDEICLETQSSVLDVGRLEDGRDLEQYRQKTDDLSCKNGDGSDTNYLDSRYRSVWFGRCWCSIERMSRVTRSNGRRLVRLTVCIRLKLGFRMCAFRFRAVSGQVSSVGVTHPSR